MDWSLHLELLLGAPYLLHTLLIYLNLILLKINLLILFHKVAALVIPLIPRLHHMHQLGQNSDCLLHMISDESFGLVGEISLY